MKGSLNLISNSNNSFGPTEEWDNIYFVDGVQTSQKIYTLYEIKLSNKTELWKNIRMNKTQTYFDNLNLWEIRPNSMKICRLNLILDPLPYFGQNE